MSDKIKFKKSLKYCGYKNYIICKTQLVLYAKIHSCLDSCLVLAGNVNTGLPVTVLKIISVYIVTNINTLQHTFNLES